jgi:4-diphosphocytidyl-2-C-methyl-D-erythritol kinase
MAELALKFLGTTAQVEIHIEKRLPVQGGLGAGSANAVAALIGLESELAIHVRGLFTRRLEIAAQVGSDVPLFLIGGTVLGLGRGQEVYPFPDIDPVWCVIATPQIGVSTPQAFRDWDTLCAREGLTQQASQAKLKELSRAYASAFSGGFPGGQQGPGSSGVLPFGENLAGTQVSALVRTGISSWIQNDFERVVFPQHPSLAEIKCILLGFGTPEAALHASLSGSGSALFGLYQTRGDAEAVRERLRAADVQSQLTRTLPRPAYWSQMLLQEED